MKTFNFNQTGGFKLTTDVLSRLQDAYKIYSGVAKMAGNLAILGGCEDLVTTVSDGFVVIDGEPLEFKGALKQATVIIKEDIINSEFEDGSIKPVETYRYATFGFSPDAVNWAEFKRVPALNTLPILLANLETNFNAKIDALTAAIGYMRKLTIFIGDINGKSIGWTSSGVGYSIQLINTVGSTTGGDDLYRITFTEPLPSSEYQIFTSVSYTGSYIANNDVIFTTTNKTVNGFDVSAREVSPDVQNLTLDFIFFKK